MALLSGILIMYGLVPQVIKRSVPDLITKDSSVFHLKPVKSIDSPCGRNSRQEAF